MSGKPALTRTIFDLGYYEEHKARGLDYAAYGYWQRSYCAMTTEITLQATYAEPAVLDGGCACGALVRGYKDLGSYSRAVGVDICEAMVAIGRDRLGLSADELIAGDLASLPLPDDSLTLINTMQVLEHIPPTRIDAVIAEFWRVLRPSGRMFHNFPALRERDPPTAHRGDPTHFNIQPVAYWPALFQRHGFVFDVESFARFVRSSRGPNEQQPANFFTTQPNWTVCTLMKPEQR